mmetsp:Transcript_10168/g.22875  ORF Transcript_10168/g.22875 Transcript_10168/m.22875 type:complete len:291 (+) Transcript_10168:970-1842(+)
MLQAIARTIQVNWLVAEEGLLVRAIPRIGQLEASRESLPGTVIRISPQLDAFVAERIAAHSYDLLPGSVDMRNPLLKRELVLAQQVGKADFQPPQPVRAERTRFRKHEEATADVVTDMVQMRRDGVSTASKIHVVREEDLLRMAEIGGHAPFQFKRGTLRQKFPSSFQDILPPDLLLIGELGERGRPIRHVWIVHRGYASYRQIPLHDLLHDIQDPVVHTPGHTAYVVQDLGHTVRTVGPQMRHRPVGSADEGDLLHEVTALGEGAAGLPRPRFYEHRLVLRVHKLRELI